MAKSKIKFSEGYDHIISLENLLEAWREFVKGKRLRKDVQEFERNLMENIIVLHNALAERSYAHSAYQHFKIADPKPRDIHKSTVRDRLLHHAVYRKLYPCFDRLFIADSFSCRLSKGTHKALARFEYFARKVSRNDTATCWVLKCDIRKFFANIDHMILENILATRIDDPDLLWLLQRIIVSFETRPSVGLPLGNLTSQLLVNIYMNEFDQFMKHRLHVEYYIRYADDFVILSRDRNYLAYILVAIECFLYEHLRLELHPNKVSITTLASGVDFLGWVHFPDHRVLRTTTKRRMLKRINENPSEESVQSYLGILKYGNAHKIAREIAARQGERS